MLSPAARILAAADVYQALTEARPHRPARDPDAAAAELRREVARRPPRLRRGRRGAGRRGAPRAPRAARWRAA